MADLWLTIVITVLSACMIPLTLSIVAVTVCVVRDAFSLGKSKEN